MLGRRLELLQENGGRFDMNPLWLADDTSLVDDSEDKLSRLMSEFGRGSERKKLLVNVGKSKDMKCSMHANVGRMDVRLYGEQFEYFKYLGWKLVVDGGCERDVVHRMNEGNVELGAMTSVLNQKKIENKCEKVAVWGSNCDNTIA